jgi:hypothetical protein
MSLFAAILTCRGRSRPPVLTSRQAPAALIDSHAGMRDRPGRLVPMGGMWVAIVPPMPPNPREFKTAREALLAWRAHWQRKTTRCEPRSR